MKFQFGSLSIELNQTVPDQLEVRIEPTIMSKPAATPPKFPPTYKVMPEILDTVRVPSREAVTKDIKMLIAAGFPRKTLSMVVNKVLGIPITGETLTTRFPEATRAALDFLSRPIPSDIWAVYVAPVEVHGEGTVTAAVGLSGKNQLVILALEASPPAEFFQKLVDRGLSPLQLKLGILSFHSGVLKEFKTAYPAAEVEFDWREFIDLSIGSEARDFLKDTMGAMDATLINEALNTAKAPKELSTFLHYNKDLWRVLKTTAPVKRLEKDLKGKMRAKSVQTKEQRELAKAFALIRLQYHWLKIPVDAPQLKNLKYMRELDI